MYLAICYPSCSYLQNHQRVDHHLQYVPSNGRTATYTLSASAHLPNADCTCHA